MLLPSRVNLIDAVYLLLDKDPDECRAKKIPTKGFKFTFNAILEAVTNKSLPANIQYHERRPRSGWRVISLGIGLDGYELPRPPAPMVLDPSTTTITVSDLRDWLQKNGHPVPRLLGGQAEAAEETEEKGGAPKSSFTEAVEWLYLKLRDEGNIEIIRPRKVINFAQKLKELVDSGHGGKSGNFEYLCERVARVDNKPAIFKITMQTGHGKRPKSKRDKENLIYTKKELSGVLSDLRKKYPIGS